MCIDLIFLGSDIHACKDSKMFLDGGGGGVFDLRKYIHTLTDYRILD